MEKLIKELVESEWAIRLKYMEEEKQYIFSFRFADQFLKGPNLVELIFDEKGGFIETKSYIFYESEGKTKEETKEMHLEEAMYFKEDMEILIKKLLFLKDKEEILFEKETYYPGHQYLGINFELDGLVYTYSLELDNPKKKVLECRYEHPSGDFFIATLENIPSLKGIGEYILNHPKVRVKLVNQLANYEK